MKSYKRIEAVRVAAEILRCLAARPWGIRAEEIASNVAANKGRVLCHLATLQDAGLAKLKKDGLWTVGPLSASLYKADKQRRAKEIEGMAQSLNKLSRQMMGE